MKIIKAGWEWVVKPEHAIEDIERIARTCYRSEDKIGPGTAERMCRMLRDRGHFAMFDHVSASVRFTVNRGVSHELVRHRVGAAYAQESTRYCDYDGEKFGHELTFIEPLFFMQNGNVRRDWLSAMVFAERQYLNLRQLGLKPEEARDVLPNALATKIVATFSFTEWRHVFKLRASWKAHPQMNEVMVPVLEAFKSEWPAVFDDLSYEEKP